jgi:hypothetical protein
MGLRNCHIKIHTNPRRRMWEKAERIQKITTVWMKIAARLKWETEL